jgi:uncharacterized membrane protein
LERRMSMINASSRPFFTLLTLVTALGCAVIAGVFFAFSSFVMPALARIAPPQGIAAMQSINVVVLNRWFLGVFLGSAVGCAALAVSALSNGSEPGAGLLLAGALSYLLGTLLVTRAFNIPRNDALAAVVPDSAEGLRLWLRYVPEWTLYNHVRGLAALVAAGCFILALLRARLPASPL